MYELIVVARMELRAIGDLLFSVSTVWMSYAAVALIVTMESYGALVCFLKCLRIRF